MDLARELKMLWNTKAMVIPSVGGGLGPIPKVLQKRLGELEIRSKNQDHPDHSAFEIGKNV